MQHKTLDLLTGGMTIDDVWSATKEWLSQQGVQGEDVACRRQNPGVCFLCQRLVGKEGRMEVRLPPFVSRTRDDVVSS